MEGEQTRDGYVTGCRSASNFCPVRNCNADVVDGLWNTVALVAAVVEPRRFLRRLFCLSQAAILNPPAGVVVFLSLCRR